MASIITVGLGFGDEGKGTLVDFLSREHSIHNVIRYNGGPQAAHNVVSPEGTWHCFAQFGSHSLEKGKASYLSQYMFVDFLAMHKEENVLEQKGYNNVYERLFIHPECPVITPFHQLVNKIRERQNLHGSCGMGVGEVFSDMQQKNLVIKATDFRDFHSFSYKLRVLLEQKITQAEQLGATSFEEYSYLKNINILSLLQHYRKIHTLLKENILYLEDTNFFTEECIYEGAQGTLLDKNFGFFPHVTPSDTTIHNAELLESQRNQELGQKIGITRCYATRHGNGPFVTEDVELNAILSDSYNQPTPWQGKMRFGWLDLIALRYSLQCNESIDGLAITCLDELASLSMIQVCYKYILKQKFFTEDIAKYFVFEEKNEELHILGIKKNEQLNLEKRYAITKVLFQARPMYRSFPAWEYVINTGQLHQNLKSWFGFLESSEGLGKPIAVLSYGKTAKEKICL
ncbi:MAG: adenylosuccinate synthetase [Spirochaetota bacterium]